MRCSGNLDPICLKLYDNLFFPQGKMMPDSLPRVWQYKPFDKHDQAGCVFFLQLLYGHRFCFRFVQPMVIAAQWKVHSDADLLHEVLRITHWCIHICAFFFFPTTARNGYKRMGGLVSRVLTNVQAKSFLVILYQDAVCLARIRRPVLG